MGDVMREGKDLIRSEKVKYSNQAVYFLVAGI
jgi:hypothetical protein